MTTPKREKVIELAKQLYFEDCYKHGCANSNNPEDSELKESGFYHQAVGQLMRDNAKADSEEWKGYNLEENFQFDVNEAMQTTTFISGSRGVGKTDIAMYVVDRLINEGIICLAFDSSCDWIRRSSISAFTTVKPYSVLDVPKESMIFDLSMLTPNQQQECIERFSEKIFQHQVETQTKTRFYLAFEESPIYFPLNALRSKKTQNTMRLLTCGRNYGVSLLAVSQFPALIDKELVKHAQQIYIGCTSEANTLKYWKSLLGKNAEKLKDLQNGQFVYYHRNKVNLIEITPFETTVTRREITISETKTTPIQPYKTSSTSGQGLTSLLIMLLWFGIFLLILIQKKVI